jgi:deazaflavin-dependent oxidoreductase (nitroreductase family)
MDIRTAKPFPAYGWLRVLPTWLYRLRPGWSLGERDLLLTYMGRRGRHMQQTLLEVVAHDSVANTYIAAGWGKRSEWFRTIQKKPHVLVDVEDHRFEAIAVRLSEAEAKSALRDYACQCPFALHSLISILTERQLHGLSDSYRSRTRSG